MTREPSARVLLIDDDERLNTLLAKYLDRFSMTVQAFTRPELGLRALKTDPPDLIVLDVMLPEMDGFAVCRKVRENSRIPIIMLTARGDVMDRIVGLELGADDYLAKPFEPRELVARMQAVLRRGQRRDSPDRLRIGTLEVDWSTRCVRLEGHDIGLTTAEFELLGLLVRSRGKVLSRDRILDGTRGIDWESYDRSIDVLISRLRQKLGDDSKHPSFIRTVRGAGYVFIGGDNA
jgi:two-component system phosphate regulon response regulator OmpR